MPHRRAVAADGSGKRPAPVAAAPAARRQKQAAVAANQAGEQTTTTTVVEFDERWAGAPARSIARVLTLQNSPYLYTRVHYI